MPATTLVGITLVELGVIGTDKAGALKWHATFIVIFLVVAHVAVIFGMLDPWRLGSRWRASTSFQSASSLGAFYPVAP